MNNNQQYSTFDLTLAGTLLSLDYQLISIDKNSDLKKVSFIFKKDQSIIDTINSYMSKQIRIEPQTLFNNIRILKSIIYSKE